LCRIDDGADWGTLDDYWICNDRLLEYVDVPESATKLWIELSDKKMAGSFRLRFNNKTGTLKLDGVLVRDYIYYNLRTFLRNNSDAKYGRIIYE
jgi:hypothetical protein